VGVGYLRRAALPASAVTVVPSLPLYSALVAPWLPDLQPPIVLYRLANPGLFVKYFFPHIFLIILRYSEPILVCQVLEQSNTSSTIPVGQSETMGFPITSDRFRCWRCTSRSLS
jgi:hypothetical protein